MIALLPTVGIAAGMFALRSPAEAVAGVGLFSVLLLLAVIDWRTYTLPDKITLPLLMAGLVLAACGMGPSWTASLLGAIVGYSSFALIAVAYRHLRGRDGLGLGDAKLLAALGAWTGVAAIPMIILGAALLGIATCAVAWAYTKQLHGGDRIPFGPFLSISGYYAFLSTRMPGFATELFRTFIEVS